MNTKALVQRARNQQEALLRIAEALDRIEAHFDSRPELASDDWAKWQPLGDTPPHGPFPLAVGPVLDADYSTGSNEALIAALQVELNEATDPEARLALEARLRLLNDKGASIPAVKRGVEVRSLASDTTILVDIPPASFEKRAERLAFACDHYLHRFLSTKTLTEDEFAGAYSKGGPMWLYLGDREAIMAMPISYRHTMIADIEEDSPIQAQEVARDILKDGEPGTKEQADGWRGL